VAADRITRRNVDELRQRMGDLLSLRNLADTLDAIGDQDLIREVFGEQPKPLMPGQTSALATSDPLCQFCQAIFSEGVQLLDTWNPSLNQRYVHHDGVGALNSAAREGCHLCGVLWDRISGGQPVDQFDEHIDMSMLEYITYSICEASREEVGYLINFIYKGNDNIFDYDKCRRLQFCVLPMRGKLTQLTDPARSSRFKLRID